MNAAALITLIQGVLPSAAPTAAGAGAVPAATQGAPGEPNAFAEALAAALAGQGAIPTAVAAAPAPPKAEQDAGSAIAAASASAAAAFLGAAAPVGTPAVSAGTPAAAQPILVSGTAANAQLAPPAEGSAMNGTAVTDGGIQPQPEQSAAGASKPEKKASTVGSGPQPSWKPEAAKGSADGDKLHPVTGQVRSDSSVKVSSFTPASRRPANGAEQAPVQAGAAQSVGAALKGADGATQSPAPSLETRPADVLPEALRSLEALRVAAESLYASSAAEVAGLGASHPEAGAPTAETAAAAAFTAPIASLVGSTSPYGSAAPPAPVIAPLPPEQPILPAALSATVTQAEPAVAETAPIAAELSASAAAALTSETDDAPRSKEAAAAKPDAVSATAPTEGGGAPAAPKAPGRDSQEGGHKDARDPAAQAALGTDASDPLEAAEPEAVFEAAAGEAAAPTTLAAEGRAAPAVRGAPETVANLAAQIARKLEGQNTRFEIALDPHGLGAVQVSVEINSKGELTAHMAFEKPEAAAELRARSAELQRALEQAGFDLSRGGLSFAEGGGREHAHDNHGRRPHARAFQDALLAAEAADTPPDHPIRLRDYARAGLDVRI